jgi:hypothetical protein
MIPSLFLLFQQESKQYAPQKFEDFFPNGIEFESDGVLYQIKDRVLRCPRSYFNGAEIFSLSSLKPRHSEIAMAKIMSVRNNDDAVALTNAQRDFARLLQSHGFEPESQSDLAVVLTEGNAIKYRGIGIVSQSARITKL